jgi:hypothetical protein
LKSQLDIFEPPAEGWWALGFAYPGAGHGSVWVIADSAEEAREKAVAQLMDLGVHPDSEPDLHAGFRRMREQAAREGR